MCEGIFRCSKGVDQFCFAVIRYVAEHYISAGLECHYTPAGICFAGCKLDSLADILLDDIRRESFRAEERRRWCYRHIFFDSCALFGIVPGGVDLQKSKIFRTFVGDFEVLVFSILENTEIDCITYNVMSDEIVLYQPDDTIKLDVRVQDDTV